MTLLSVNASQPIRTADARWFGFNTPMWDSELDTPQTLALLTNMGTQALRFPGGSDSDDYHWLYNRQDNDNWSWATSLANFIHVVTNIGAETMITLNYGTGSTNEAAAWVAYVNASTGNTRSLGTDTNNFNWQTAGYWASLRAAAPLATDDGKNFLRISRTAPLGFKYWEIGNELYGSWETDSNMVAHDPYTYAVRAKAYISLMKAVDPTVKIGVVVTPGQDSYINNANHPAYNPVTEQTHYGWTPVLLATLKSLGVTPDFAIYHNYPQNPGSESDAGLLGTSGAWASAATDLRGQITDYMGSIGTNIELVCTENNSVSSAPGKQSVSLVNGLYKMESMAQLMQTEFNGLFWWALRNGVEYDGNMSTSLYGWREYGDYGVVDSGFTNVYPTYDATELMTNFVQTGDTVITAASDYSLLSTYAVQRQNGSLTVLTINKDPVNTLTGQVVGGGLHPRITGGGLLLWDTPGYCRGRRNRRDEHCANKHYHQRNKLQLLLPALLGYRNGALTVADNPIHLHDKCRQYSHHHRIHRLWRCCDHSNQDQQPGGHRHREWRGFCLFRQPEQRHDSRQCYQHRGACVLWLRQSDRRRDRHKRRQHRGICILPMHQPGQRRDRHKRHQHRGICILRMHQPGQRHDSQQRHQHRKQCVPILLQPDRGLFPGQCPGADATVFANDKNATAYYLPGTTGWEATFGGISTALRFLPNALILNNGRRFGVHGNRFGFIVSWATNISIVVEACTNLASPVWTPLQTNTLTNGSLYFSEPLQTNGSGRYYRISLP